MAKFTVGDIITGIVSAYHYTGIGSRSEVVRVSGSDLRVRLLKSAPGAEGAIGMQYDVKDGYFVLEKSICKTCHQTLPLTPIVIGKHCVEFNEDGIKVGYTSVTKDQVKEIYERLFK